MRRYLSVVILIIFVLSYSSCVTLSEEQRREYGILESAVTFSSDKIIGEYGDEIPDDFNSKDRFMGFVKGKIPEDYYNMLEKYILDVKPMGTYYLLLIRDPHNECIILFDYSCTPEADGPILLEPSKYEINNLDLYDTCKNSN